MLLMFYIHVATNVNINDCTIFGHVMKQTVYRLLLLLFCCFTSTVKQL